MAFGLKNKYTPIESAENRGVKNPADYSDFPGPKRPQLENNLFKFSDGNFPVCRPFFKLQT